MKKRKIIGRKEESAANDEPIKLSGGEHREPERVLKVKINARLD